MQVLAAPKFAIELTLGSETDFSWTEGLAQIIGKIATWCLPENILILSADRHRKSRKHDCRNGDGAAAGGKPLHRPFRSVPVQEQSRLIGSANWSAPNALTLMLLRLFSSSYTRLLKMSAMFDLLLVDSVQAKDTATARQVLGVLTSFS